MKSSLALLASALILQGFAGQAWSQAEFQTLATFPQTPGYPKHGVVRAADGTFYGVSRFGGTGDAGALFAIDETSGSVTDVANFATIGVELGDERVGMAADDSDAIFGIAAYGGANGDGAIWKWTAADGLVRMASFDEAASGQNPRGELVTDGAGNFYGVCVAGGAYGDGTLWKWSATGGLVRLYSFQDYGDALSLGGRPRSIALVNGALFGVTAEKDNGTGPDIPVLWCRSAAGVMKQAAVFDTDILGYPQGGIVVTGSGVAGISYTNSTTETGTPKLWVYPGTGTAITNAHTFAATDARLTIGSDGEEIYGTTEAGRIWHRAFTGAFALEGTYAPASVGKPAGSIVVLGTGDVFGTAILDTDGSGTFWKWNQDDGTSIKANFQALTLGGDPSGVHVDSQGNVYGIEMIRQFLWRWSDATGPAPQKVADVETPLVGFVTFGGVVGDDQGNVFGFTKLGASGPAGGLWRWNALSGLVKVGAFGTAIVPGNATGHIARDPESGAIWGTTEQPLGTKKIVHLWRWTSALGLRKVATLDSADGEGPVKAITVGPGGAIYGVCAGGGTAGKGTLWAWIDSTGFNNLADFGAPTPITTPPGAGLAVTPLGTVYGVTETGGADNAGRIWRWVPVVGLTVVKDFVTATTGAMDGTDTGMIVATDGALYGCASSGGGHGVGTLWKCTLGGTPALTALHHFNPTVMAHPQPNRLVQATDGMIYGIALHGVWRYGVASSNPQAPVAVTLPMGYLSASRVVLEGSVNARGNDATVTFELGTKADEFTLSQPATPGTATGSSATPVSAEFTGLLAKTTYFYRIKAESSVGTGYSSVASFTTSATLAPLVVTKVATLPTPASLTLNATITPRSSLDTLVFFDVGTSATALTTVVPVTTGAITGNAAVNVSVVADSLLPHTKYFFRARAQHDNGAAAGVVLSATTGNNSPSAADDAFTVLPSATVDLTVLGNDTDPDSDTLTILSFSIPPVAAGKVVKVGNVLRFTATAAFTSATINYTVSDGFGGTDTGVCSITRGTATLSETAHTLGSEGGSYSVDITTPSSWATVEALTWASAAPAAGTGNGSTTITVLPNPAAVARIGTVVIGGVAHNITQNGVSAPTVAMPDPLPAGIVGAPYSISVPTTGRPVTYKLVGVLPPGLVFGPMGTITGTPTKSGDFPLTVRAINAANTSAPVTFTIHIDPLPASVIGSFTALLDRGTLNRDLGGWLTLSTTSTGSASGTLRLAELSYPFSGKMLSSTDASVDPVADFTIARRGTTALLVKVKFDQPGTNKISVEVNTAGNTGAPVTGLGARTLGTTTISAANYTSIFEPTTDPDEPQGNGFATFKTTTTGAVTWSGRLADGTVLTGAGLLNPDNALPMWHLLYANQGCVHGRATFAGAPTQTVGGTFTWFKKPQPGRLYRDGIGPMNCTIAGSLYAAPATGVIVLGLTDKADNARLEFFAGGIGSSEQAAATRQIFTINTLNKPLLDLPGSADNLTGVKLTLIPSTGYFSGSFTLRDSNVLDPARPHLRPVTFQGLLVNSLGKGAGYFLLNQLPSAGKTLLTSDILSGQVVLDAAPSP